MARLIPMPSPRGTNIERLGIPAPDDRAAYDSKFGLVGRKLAHDEDPEETDQGEGEYQRPDPLTELFTFLKENLANPDAYTRAEQLVTSALDWIDPAKGSPAEDQPPAFKDRPRAMDSAQVLRQVHATMAAQAHTTPVVGPIEASSAAATYRIALKRLGADGVPNIDHVPALKRLFDLARRSPLNRSTTSSLTDRFPDANRLKRCY